MTKTQLLGSLLRTTKGKRPRTLSDSPRDGWLPYIDLAAAEHGTKRQWADPSDAKVVPEGTLVMVWDGARSGWIERTKFAGALGSTLAALDSSLNPRFLAAFLKAHYKDINLNYRGSGIPHVNPDYLNALEVPNLDDDQQVAVAAILESARERASAALARVSRAEIVLARLRDSLLAAACSGRMTKDLRVRDDEAEDVESTLVAHAASSDAVVNKRRIKPAHGLALVDFRDVFPASWAYRHIRELVELKTILDIQDGNHGELYPRKADFEAADGVPFISAESVDEEVLFDTAPRLKAEVAERLRIGFALPRDVILTHNATVGRAALMPANAPYTVLSTSTTYYRVDERVLLPEYLLLFMRSPYFQRQLGAVMEQTTRNQVPVTKQVELSLAIPPIDEQRAIVTRAGLALDSVRVVAARLAEARSRVEWTSAAVTSKAFRAG